jgi:hypothetical protein
VHDFLVPKKFVFHNCAIVSVYQKEGKYGMFSQRSGKVIENTILISFVLSILPFFWICYFSQPGADDFVFAFLAKKYGYWGVQAFLYNTSVGRFFYSAQVAFLTLTPLNIIEYKIVCILMLILLLAVSYMFIRTFIPELNSKRKRLMCVLGISYLFYSRMPGTSDLYWSGANLQYFLPTLMTIVLAVIFKNLSTASKTFTSAILILAGVLLVPMIVGSNETSMVLLWLVTLIQLYFFPRLNQRQRILAVLVLFFTIVFSVIAIAAPGNLVRGKYLGLISYSTRLRHVAQGLVACFYTQFIHFNGWCNLTFLAILAGYAAYILKCPTEKYAIRPQAFHQTVAVFIFYVLFIFFGALPASVIYGSPGPTRTNGVAYLNFLFVMLIVVRNLIHAFKSKVSDTTTFLKTAQLPKPSPFVLFVICFVLFCCIFCQKNIVEAYKDLAMKKASYYNDAMYSTYKTAIKQRDAGVKNIELEPIPVTKMPKTFGGFFDEDSTAYHNRGYAGFLGVYTVRALPQKKTTAEKF